MTNMAFQRDVGSLLVAKSALNPVTVTAATTADGQEINGTHIDRQAFTHDMPLSCKVIAEHYGSLAAAKTATLAFNLQHADSTTGAWTDYNDRDGTTVATVTQAATTASQTFNNVTVADYSLGAAKRWIRVQVTPTLSATATDTLDYGGVVVFGGYNVDPAA